MRLKQYKNFNKSLWFIFPMIADEVLIFNQKNNSREIYLIDSHLENTYIYPSKDKRMFYVKYDNSPEVVDIEDYLECDYLVDVKYTNKSTIYIYEITGEEDSEIYDQFINGEYSKIDLDYKWKVCNMFKLRPSDFLWKVFKKDNVLWHLWNKKLSCKKGDKCQCSIITDPEVLEPKNQPYFDCKNYKHFNMPDRRLIELEDKIDIKRETIKI